MANHIIHQQKVVLKTAKNGDALALQNRLGLLLRNELPGEMEAVLDKLSLPNEVIRIDTLQVELGILTAENFEAQFKERLLARLTDAITDLKESTHSSRSASDFGDGGINSKTVLLSPALSLSAAIQYFLENGSLPWYRAQTDTVSWEKEMGERFSEADWQRLRQWLQQNEAPGSIVLRRLTSQFSEVVLEKLLQPELIFPSEEWKRLYEDVIEIFSQPDDNHYLLKRAVWLAVTSVWQQRIQGTAATKRVLEYTSEHLKMPLVDSIAAAVQKPNFNRSKMIKEAIHGLTAEVKAKSVDKEKTEVQSEGPRSILQNQTAGEATETELKNPKTKAHGEQSSGEENRIELTAVNPALQEKKRLPQFVTETQYVSNAGVILLHPFLEMYFAELALVKQKGFVDEAARQRAVLLLHYLATGETNAAEFNLGLQKLLCSFPAEETLPAEIILTEREGQESEQLLQSVINYCPPLKNTSLAGLRSTFLQRDGRLEKKENGWLLTVEQKTVDILLDKLPWGFSTIKFPWQAEMINVNWC